MALKCPCGYVGLLDQDFPLCVVHNEPGLHCPRCQRDHMVVDFSISETTWVVRNRPKIWIAIRVSIILVILGIIIWKVI